MKDMYGSEIVVGDLSVLESNLSEKDIRVLGCILSELSKELYNGNDFDTVIVPEGTFDACYTKFTISDQVKVLVRDSRLFNEGQIFFINSRNSF